MQYKCAKAVTRIPVEGANMPPSVPVVSEKILARSWGTLRLYEIDYLHSDGSRQVLKREVYDHGHAAAVLLHDPARDTVALVRQFRLPAQLNGAEPYLIEVCAGLLDGDDPETCARREALEETGITVTSLRAAFNTIVSPGSLTETIACFIGTYDGPAFPGNGNGLKHEGEDIEMIELSFDTAFAMIASGQIVDAKTIALLQALKLEKCAEDLQA
jgi:nudix-type nucleoside diphosphatase (YffH/AdpP family)